MHLLILGGTGFVGSRLTRRILACAGWEVEAYGSAGCDLTKPQSVQFLQDRMRPDTCILFCSTIARLRDDSLKAFHGNVAMAEHVAEAAATRPFRSMIFCSSIDVYGRPPSACPLTEHSAINPAGYYGLAKYVSERILHDRIGERVPLAVLRLPGIFSLDQADNSVLGNLFNALKKNQPIELSGGGYQKRNYLHINELDALVQMVIAERWSGILNLGSSRSHSIGQAVELMRDHLGSYSRIDHTEPDGTEFDINIDDTALRSHFPRFVPRPLEVCLEDFCGAS